MADKKLYKNMDNYKVSDEELFHEALGVITGAIAICAMEGDKWENTLKAFQKFRDKLDKRLGINRDKEFENE